MSVEKRVECIEKWINGNGVPGAKVLLADIRAKVNLLLWIDGALFVGVMIPLVMIALRSAK